MAKKRGYFRLSFKEVFSAKGRIDRMTYLMYGLIFYIASLIIGFITGFAYSLLAVLTKNEVSAFALNGLVLLAVLPVLYASFSNVIKRLHDINLPGLLVIIPLALVTLPQILDFDAIYPFLPADFDTLKKPVELYTNIVSFLIGLGLLLIPGTKGANRYGSSTTEYYGGKADLPKPKILEG